MIGERKRQSTFIDDVLKLRIPRDNPLVKIKHEIDFGFVEEETKDLYCSDNGRPSYPPELLFKMLFLEFYENLSDVGAFPAGAVEWIVSIFSGPWGGGSSSR